MRQVEKESYDLPAFSFILFFLFHDAMLIWKDGVEI